MPSGNTHKLVGLSVGCALPLLVDSKNESFSLEHFALFAITGVGFGRLPDILEPALGNPNHRNFFHSIAIGIVICYFAIWVWNSLDQKISSERKKNGDVLYFILTFIFVALVAYLSHLALDGLTKKGLPII